MNKKLIIQNENKYSEIINNMSEQVQEEIDKYIKTQSTLIESIQNSESPLALPTKLEYTAPNTALTIDVLNNNRVAQEAFLKQYQDQYNFITNLRQKYAIDLAEVNTVLSEQTTELAELEQTKKQLAIGSSTEYRKLKTEKYNQAKQEYYYHLYMICGAVLLIVVGILICCKMQIIPRATGLVLFLIAMILLCCYVVYYVFFSTRARDIMVFDRFRYPINGDGLSTCATNNSGKSSNNNADIDSKIADILTSTDGKCPVKLVPEAEMPNLPTTTTTAAV